MAITHLRWLCAAVFFVASINAYSKISIAGVDLRGIEPHQLRKELDNLKRDTKISMKAATSKGYVTASTVIGESWGKTAIKNAVKTGLKAGKGTLVTIAGTYALEYVLDKTGWFDDNGVLSTYETDDIPEEYKVWKNAAGKTYSSPREYLDELNRGLCRKTDKCTLTMRYDMQPIRGCVYTPFGSGTCGHSVYLYKSCPGKMGENNVCIPVNSQRVTDKMIDSLDLSGYTPKYSDIPFLKPHLGKPDKITIERQPEPIQLPTVIGTTQNPDGSTTSTQEDTTVNITINNNNNILSASITETTTTTTYRNGEKTDQKTETTTTDHSNATPSEPAGKIDIPLDCELVPTLCKQDKDFYDWMREPFNEPLPEFKGVEERKGIEQKRTVDFGSASCPAPIEINTVLAGTLRISFQPWCDFAGMIKYLVLAASYLLAIRINLGVIRG